MLLDQDKFERRCCQKENEILTRKMPHSTVNYNQIKFDPNMKGRPVDFDLWVNSNTTKSVRQSVQ